MRTQSMFRTLFVALFLVVFMQMSFARASSGIHYQGRLTKPDGRPLDSRTVQFRIQIRTPGSEDCLMYEEIQTKDMSNSDGKFSLDINDGTGRRIDTANYLLEHIFSNFSDFDFEPTNCQNQNQGQNHRGKYHPEQMDGRNLVVYFKDESMRNWEALPVMKFNFTPMALQSLFLGGFSIKNILRVENTSGPQEIPSLTPQNFADLMSLLSGSSSKYTPSSANSGTSLVVASSSPSTPSQGSIWFDSTTKTVKYYDGTTVRSISGGSTATTEMTSGSIGGSTTINTSGSIATSGNIRGTNFSGETGNFLAINLFEPTFKYKIGLLAPNSLAVNYALTLPTTAGIAGQVLANSGNGTLSWSTPDSNATRIQGVSVGTGTPTASGQVLRFDLGSNKYVPSFLNLADIKSTVSPGTNIFPTNCSASQTMIWNSMTDSLVCTPISIPSSALLQVVGIDKGGTGMSVVGAPFQVLSVSPNGSTLEYRTIAAVTRVSTGTGLVGGPIESTGTIAVDVGTAPNKIVQLDNFGRLPAVDGSAIMNLNFANFAPGVLPTERMPALIGDVNSQAGSNQTFVFSVGGSSAQAIHQAEVSANAATSMNVPATIVKRDDAGNISINSVTVGTVNIQSADGAGYQLTLPETSGKNGQLLAVDGSGHLKWVDPPAIVGKKLGYDHTIGAAFTMGAGHMNAARVNSGFDSTITRLGLFLSSNGPGKKVVVGIYSSENGLPGTLLAQSREYVTVANDGGYRYFDLNIPVAIKKDTAYWLAVVSDSALQVEDAFNSPATGGQKYRPITYTGTMPQAFGGSVLDAGGGVAMGGF